MKKLVNITLGEEVIEQIKPILKSQDLPLSRLLNMYLRKYIKDYNSKKLEEVSV